MLTYLRPPVNPPALWYTGDVEQVDAVGPWANAAPLVDLTNPLSPTGAIQSLLKIRNKNREVVPFRFNRVQADLAKRVPATGARVVVLKHRQPGVSALRLADMFCKACSMPGYNGVVVSFERGATRRLLDRVRFYHDNLAVPELKLILFRNNAGEIKFKETDATLFIGTAGQSAFGRGDTIHDIHFSEPARYDPITGTELIKGLTQALVPDGNIWYESTPNGQSGIFWDLWQAVTNQEKDAGWGSGVFQHFFYPWWWTEEYVIPGDEAANIKPSPDEEHLMLSFGVTKRQIGWRRRKIADLDFQTGGSGLATFLQEYPEDEVTCFLASGACYFPASAIRDHMLRCRPPLQERSNGVWVWRTYNPAHRYVVAMDSSEGIEGATESQSGDFATIGVLDASSNEFVATLKARVTPEVLAGIGMELGMEYGRALLAPERNNMGLVVIGKVVEAGYPNLYLSRIGDPQHPEFKQGWITNTATRPLLLAGFHEGLRDGGITLYDARIVAEASSFSRQKSGRIEAGGGAHDDLLFACMIAWHVREEALVPVSTGSPVNVSRFGRR